MLWCSSFNKFSLSTYYVPGTILSSVYNQRNYKRLNKFVSDSLTSPNSYLKSQILLLPLCGSGKMEKPQSNSYYLSFLAPWIPDNCFLASEVTFRSIKFRSKQKAENRIRWKCVWVQLSSELEFNWDSKCHSPLHSSVPDHDQVHGCIAPSNPCNGLQSWGSSFCLLSGQPLSHMECGKLWLLGLAIDGPLFRLKKPGIF